MQAILEWGRGHPMEVITIALVLVTIYYARQTRRSVEEVVAARAASIKPSIRLHFGTLPPDQVFLIVENVGTGPALGVDLRFALTGFTSGADVQTYATPMLRVGEARKFLYPTWGKVELMQLKSLQDVPVSIELTGMCMDTDGRQYDIHDAIHFSEAQGQLALLPWHLERPDEAAALDRIAGELSTIRLAVQARGGEV